jgi:hypothetical protein
MSSPPDELLEVLKQLDENVRYGLMCHSSKENEVKEWGLPYKIISNEWFDMALSNKEMIYVIPIEDNKPIQLYQEI